MPRINAIREKYHKPTLPPIALGGYVSFVDADDLYRYMRRFEPSYVGDCPEWPSMAEQLAMQGFQPLARVT